MTNQTDRQTEKFTWQAMQEYVTNTIIEQLEKGVVPWERSWKGENALLNGLPFNTETNEKYRGINILLLWSDTIKKSHQTNEWGTFNHWNKAGEFIRKNETGTYIMKFGTVEKEIDGEIEKFPYVKRFKVFNKCQLQSWKPAEVEPSVKMSLTNAIEKDVLIEDFVSNTAAFIVHHNGDPSYNRVDDKIRMPVHENFVDTATLCATEAYYSTLLHELTHWSGAQHRLNRTKGKKFGDQEYAFEELVAEIGSAYLCSEFDISTLQKGEHASYIEGWIKVLKDNKQMLVSAASDASKAFEYLNSLQPKVA